MTTSGGGGGEVYRRELDAVLPRVLALADRDPLSPTAGVGDRQFWAWKLIDFPNATFQGVAHGLAVLLAHDLLAPEISRAKMLARIADAFKGTGRITRPSGHLEEALPFERSFCVTALVAYDLLSALEELEAADLNIDIDAPERIVAPLIQALQNSDETHGLISNHLATASAALFRWHRLTGSKAAEIRGQVLLKRVLDHQSDEGWFVEYGGADPGYQTLCVSYLTDVLAVTGDERLRAALAASARFLSFFAHPDGSFGGLYGSRATRIYYPAGIEVLAHEVPEAAALAHFMRASIDGHNSVPLAAIDQPNLIPLFNNYARAARLPLADTAGLLPCEDRRSQRVHFKKAGIIVACGAAHHTVISTHKGGVIHHHRTDVPLQINPGVACRDPQRRIYTSQRHDPASQVTIDGNRVIVEAGLTRLVQHRPNLWNFLVLRLLCATLMRISAFSELIKRQLAKRLISGSGKAVGRLRRHIELGPELKVEDEILSGIELRRIELTSPFSAVHMASQGYWQLQDDQTDRAA